MRLKTSLAVFVTVLLIIGALDLRFTVRPVISGPATITVPDDYPTIQEAINNATDGSTIFVRAGTYPEHLIIDKPLSLIGEDRNSTIIDAKGTFGEIVCVTSDYTYIEGFTFQGVGHASYYGTRGVLNFSSSNNIITNNIITNNGMSGIVLDSSHNNSIVHNDIISNHYGIILHANSTDNIITGNTIIGDDRTCILLAGASNNMIVANNISYSSEGIMLINYEWYDLRCSASNNSLIDNYLAGNFHGIIILSSPNNTMKNNTLMNNEWSPFQVNAFNYDSARASLSNFIQNIDESNTIDGRPIIYAVNRQNERINVDASYVALVNCTNMTVENLQLNSGGSIVLAGTTNSTLENLNVTGVEDCGIFLFRSNNNLIYGCEVHENSLGIGLESSWSNTIEYSDVVNNQMGGVNLYGVLGGANQNRIVDNNLSNNRRYGLRMIFASDNYVAHNTVRENRGAGISLSGLFVRGTHNLVCYNDIVNNTCGVEFIDYFGDRIYGNNFLNNEQQAYIYSPSPGYTSRADAWDDGYPSGGNYWSDYTGVDSNEDGIGDTPYVVDPTNIDRYPLMNPYGSAPSPVLISPANTSIYSFQSVTFTSTTSGGKPPYSYQWYLNDLPVSGANSNSWTLASPPIGNNSVYLSVTDSLGNSAKSNQASVTVVRFSVDLNNDGRADMRDLSIVASAFGSSPGQPRWNKTADVNQDGKVDLKDIALVAKHFGEHYSWRIPVYEARARGHFPSYT
jgi:parallel beta-helix repeat protein